MQNSWLSAFALGIVAGLGSATPAAADVVINGTFYEETALAGCSAGVCSLDFTAPANKVLFSKVSCAFVATSSTSQLSLVQYGVKDTPSAMPRRAEYLLFGPQVQGLTSKLQTINAPTDFLSAPGKIPNITVALDSNASTGAVTCKLTGRIQP